MPSRHDARFAAFALILAAAAIGTRAEADPPWLFVSVPNAMYTTPVAINGHNHIAGTYVDQSSVAHGFVRMGNGTIESIDLPGMTGTGVTAINYRGDIVGTGVGDHFDNHGFLYTASGTYVQIDVPGTNRTVATAINESGVIVGNATTNAGASVGFVRDTDGTFETFTVSSAQNIAVAAIDQRGWILGDYSDATSEHAFLRTRKGHMTTFDFPGASATAASSMNDKGEITGSYITNNGGVVYHGFLREPDGTISTLDVSGPGIAQAQQVLAGSINAKGEITGWFIDTDGHTHGFVRDSKGRYVQMDCPGAKATRPVMIGTTGKIIGTIDNSDGSSTAFRFNHWGWRRKS